MCATLDGRRACFALRDHILPLCFSLCQVRFRIREKRQPLDESQFRKYLFHYDGPKFRLELSHAEVSQRTLSAQLIECTRAKRSHMFEQTPDECHWMLTDSSSSFLLHGRLITCFGYSLVSHPQQRVRR